jgi:hypothetical protein
VGATNARVHPSITEGHIMGPRHIRAMKGLCFMGARGQRVYRARSAAWAAGPAGEDERTCDRLAGDVIDERCEP